MKKFKDLNCILLVDDDSPTNFIHAKVIEKAAIATTIKAITNVKEALEFLTYSGSYQNSQEIPRPGIIFLDINMPGLNGWDFMEEYHKLDQHYKAQAIVIMLTTSLNPADRDRAHSDTEIVTFLHKPLRPQIVLDIVSQHFKEAQ